MVFSVAFSKRQEDQSTAAVLEELATLVKKEAKSSGQFVVPGLICVVILLEPLLEGANEDGSRMAVSHERVHGGSAALPQTLEYFLQSGLIFASSFGTPVAGSSSDSYSADMKPW